MSRLVVINSMNSNINNCRNRVTKTIKNIDDVRTNVEKIRKERVNKINKDLKKIAEREREYANEFIKEMVPVKVVWNEEFIEVLNKYAPFRVEKDETYEKNNEDDEIVNDAEEEKGEELLSTVEYSMDEYV